MIKAVSDLEVFTLSYNFAMDIFKITKSFPKETKIWLLFARDSGYIKTETFEEFSLKFDEIGAKLYKLHENWKTF